MSLRDAATDVGMKAMNVAHRSVLKLSGGRVLASPFGMPAVELVTTGRKSGQSRATMLTAPVVDGERIVLVASKGGDDRDPDWYRNLVANPEVEVALRGERRRLRARTASAEERAELWPAIVKAYKGYDGYQRRTGREIPVVICEP